MGIEEKHALSAQQRYQEVSKLGVGATQVTQNQIKTLEDYICIYEVSI